MWMSKFLDIREALENIPKKLRGSIKKDKLTPLEFTILETIYNNVQISGYDLIASLNKHFAKTWKARSGTIYPILSKLKHSGFLISKSVKSPIGPMITMYRVTEAGKKILTAKVSMGFDEQIEFVKNFLLELATVYIDSFPKKEQKKQTEVIEELLQEMVQSVMDDLPTKLDFISEFVTNCPECNNEVEKDSKFCDKCGFDLSKTGTKGE